MGLIVDRKEETQLTANFKGSTVAKEIESYYELIQSGLKTYNRLKRVVFDFSSSNRQMHVAGRIFDMASSLVTQPKYSRIHFEIRLPRDIYEDLQISGGFPDLEDDTGELSGVSIVILDALPTVNLIASMQAKVREVNGDIVTVSFFADEDEIVGELDIRQFPGKDVQSGGMYTYEATVTEKGKTEVIIKQCEEAEVSGDDILDIWEEVRRQIPDDDT